ncbi:MAG: winged helix-turn-helix domain-containing protein, partial [Kluyvera sp.]
MRYNINARFIYDATDGTLTLPESDEPDSQLSITASALLFFFLRNTGVISREEVLKKVWDDNGLTSSNSNLNQYLSMLRKTFRHYGIDNIIVTVSRGYLQLNPDVVIEALDDTVPEITDITPPVIQTEPPPQAEESAPPSAHARGMCWYMAGVGLLVMSLL